jgi:GNAT superfamily N-acetyltransferase
MLDIKILQKKDPETIAKLNRVVQERHLELFRNSFKEFNYDSILEAVESLLKKNEYWSFIAYLDEPPIGYAIVFKRKFEENPFRNSYTALVIDQMCVITEFQHQGVGSQLVSEVRDFAEKMGVDKLELTVWSKNKEARSFYHRIGFNTLMEYMRMEI